MQAFLLFSAILLGIGAALQLRSRRRPLAAGLLWAAVAAAQLLGALSPLWLPG
ncbi:hypothetical protein ACTHPH_22650 [Paenibacillus pasadenensis]|uniref:Uncharacterized protein n=1 Tax=Paenibacillus pasadenensis TaxID=217090 RepID=A0A2N5N197_9BACL|nr:MULTISPECIES: hypothetical protein [Paenibacillus]PLT44118.1 hypothetical protein B8V81_2549 [Paenibacillus pasadenensis]QGG54647.1 hypothetical protein GE073_02900 [Paenibacillus sp. B01]